MTDVALVLRQVRYEQKSFWRNPASAFFAFAFPVMFLLIFGSLNKGSSIDSMGNIPYNSYYIPALITFGVIGACLTNICMSITIRRDSGVLKRLRGTPLPAWIFMTGLIGSSAVVSAILAALITGLGMVFYGVHAPHHPATLLLVLLVGGGVMCALGLALSSLIPNADSAPAITNAVVLPLLFISGTFFPLDPTSTLSRIADWFPMRHFALALFASFDPQHTQHGLPGDDLWVMLIWGVVGLVVAVRKFQWEPRRS